MVSPKSIIDDLDKRMDDAIKAEKLKGSDYFRNPTYERRYVVFFDVLGWRSKIQDAGEDPEELGKLRRLLLQLTKVSGATSSISDMRYSSFSDNMVLSFSEAEHLAKVLYGIGIFQLGAAQVGFLIRGGLTLGQIVHDKDVVFGPALNRAYEIESTIAIYPRIVIDQDVVRKSAVRIPFIDIEEGITFLDPFTLRFVALLQSTGGNPDEKALLKSVGLPSYKGPKLSEIDPALMLAQPAGLLRQQLLAPLHDKEWIKLAWLHDRIVKQFGLPSARTFPRVRPDRMPPTSLG
jgi:hypothetical protein